MIFLQENNDSKLTETFLILYTALASDSVPEYFTNDLAVGLCVKPLMSACCLVPPFIPVNIHMQKYIGVHAII